MRPGPRCIQGRLSQLNSQRSVHIAQFAHTDRPGGGLAIGSPRSGLVVCFVVQHLYIILCDVCGVPWCAVVCRGMPWCAVACELMRLAGRTVPWAQGQTAATVMVGQRHIYIASHMHVRHSKLLPEMEDCN